MTQADLYISEKQARIFARAIYKNVSAYIQTHQKEYVQFLLEQKGVDEYEENQSTYRPKRV